MASRDASYFSSYTKIAPKDPCWKQDLRHPWGQSSKNMKKNQEIAPISNNHPAGLSLMLQTMKFYFQLKRQSIGGVIALICKMVINKTKIKFMIDSLINNSLFILIKDKGCLSVCLSGPDTIVGLYVRKAGGLEKCKSYKTVLFG